MASQTKKRSQVSSGKASIRVRQKTIDAIGSQGQSGTRKPRLRSGWVLRITKTPTETTIKANRVPMLERSANVPMSQTPAGMPTTRPAIQVEIWGVRNVG